MDYIDRIDRILKIDKLNREYTLFTSGLNGESAYVWERLKDLAPLRISIDGEPDLHKWCTDVYNLLPNDTKINHNRHWSDYLPYTTARKEKEPLAVMLDSLKKWLERNPGVLLEKLIKDNVPFRLSILNQRYGYKEAVKAD